MDQNEAINLLRGEPGQKVTLTILRPLTKEIKDFTITRENITVASVKDAKILPEELGGDFKIGYARITQFNMPTAGELGKKLDDLEAKGMQAFILDLRYNPGGLLNSAVDVCGQFLPPKTLVVSTEGRVASQSRQYHTSDVMKTRPRFPMAILINGGSASGSEIVARRAERPQPRHSRRRNDLWQRLRAKRHSAPGRFRDASHHRQIFHAQPRRHP